MKARLALARTYAELRENQKAADELQEILSVDPANSEAKAQRGHLALEAGQQEAALKWTTQALSVDPNNLTAIENFAVLMERQGKPTEARIALQKLVSSNPRNPRFHYLLGRLLSKLHQPDEAKAEFELSKQLEAVPVAPSQ